MERVKLITNQHKIAFSVLGLYSLKGPCCG